MSLPDRFERVGIVAGSTLVLAIPTSLLTNVFYGLDMAYPLIVVWFVPGFVVGVLIALGSVPFEYRDVWYVGVVGGVLASVGLGTLEVSISTPTDRPLLAGVTIAVSLAAALGLSRLRLGRFLPA